MISTQPSKERAHLRRPAGKLPQQSQEVDSFLLHGEDGFGGLVINTPDGIFDIEPRPSAIWGQARVEGKPDSVSAQMAGTSTTSGIVLVHALDSQPATANQNERIWKFPESIRLPVKWNGRVPQVKSSDLAGDGDAIFLRPDGQFAHLEASIVSFRGKFYVTCQTLFVGYVRKFGERLFVTASRPEYNFPGADYLKMTPVSQAVVDRAVELGYVCTGTPNVPEWSPAPCPTPSSDDLVGSVAFWNMAAYYGGIVNAEGKMRHFGLRNTDHDGKFPYFAPGDAVFFRDSDPDSHWVDAQSVRLAS
jgi:hypothetical protein